MLLSPPLEFDAAVHCRLSRFCLYMSPTAISMSSKIRSTNRHHASFTQLPPSLESATAVSVRLYVCLGPSPTAIHQHCRCLTAPLSSCLVQLSMPLESDAAVCFCLSLSVADFLNHHCRRLSRV